MDNSQDRPRRGGLRLPGWATVQTRAGRVRTREAVRRPQEQGWRRWMGEATEVPLPAPKELRVAGRRWPASGSECSADLWWVVPGHPAYRLILIDILGHGDLPAVFGWMLWAGMNVQAHHSRPAPGARGCLDWTQQVIDHMGPPPEQQAPPGLIIRAVGGAVDLDLATGRAEMAGRGMYGVHRSSPGRVDFYRLAGMPMDPDVPGQRQDNPLLQQDVLRPGDRLWIMTDGILEAMDPKGRFFINGIEPVLYEAHGQPLDRAVETVHAAAMRHAGLDGQSDLYDDATVVVMEYVGP